MDHFLYTNVGGHEPNCDHAQVIEHDGQILIVLCDGLNGLPNGDQAAQIISDAALAALIEGKAPADAEGIVLEKRYAEEHDLKVDDSFDIAGTTYNISGIGVVSDYDAPFKGLADTSCNSKSFGPVFVTDEAYESFKK